MENANYAKFLQLLSELENSGVDYCLIGGFAIVLHGSSRLTEDIDIFIRSNEENLQRLRNALDAVFHDSSINEITKPELEAYPVIRYSTEEGFSIDIMARLGDAFTIDDLVIEPIEVNGKIIKVASPETLYLLKEKTYRAVDQADLLFLSHLIKNRKQDNA